MPYTYIKYILSLCLLAVNLTIQANPTHEPTVKFTVVSSGKEGFTANIDIGGLPHSGNWELGFNSKDTIRSVDNGTLILAKQGGNFYLIKFIILDQEKRNISFVLKGKGAIKKHTDVPSGYFLIANPVSNNPQLKPKLFTIRSENFLLPWKYSDASRSEINLKRKTIPLEGYPQDQNIAQDAFGIIPLPVETIKGQGKFILDQNTLVAFSDSDSQNAAEFFINAIQSATGFKLKSKANIKVNTSNTIFLQYLGANEFKEDKHHEGYILDVKPQSIHIYAHSRAGFIYAFQTLRQLMPNEVFSHSRQFLKNWTIQSVHIKDFPRFEFRGIHLDTSRHFFSVQDIMRFIDLISLHKLNHFSWDLSDDEGWRLEIKRYPQLTLKGAWRGYDPTSHDEKALLPALGSGPSPYGGYYTQKEIREVVRYASDRNVTIVPGIDLPGHARALIMSLPKELVDRHDNSVYTSIQGYHDNVLSPCIESTFEVLDNIITEIAELFPGEYIHIGGDEVPDGVWEKSCLAKKYDVKDPFFKEKMVNNFMLRIQEIIAKKGKKMAGWEELANENSTLAPPLRIHVWNDAKAQKVYKTSALKGYKVIMGPAENLYFDEAYNSDPNEPGQYWAGYVDTFSAYSLTPIRFDQGQTDLVIQGVQGQLWSELLKSSASLDYMAFPKIAGLSELGWTPAQQRNWTHFSQRMSEKHLKRLDFYGVKYKLNEFE